MRFRRQLATESDSYNLSLLTAGWIGTVLNSFPARLRVINQGRHNWLGPLNDITFGCQTTSGENRWVTQQQAVIFFSIFVGQVKGNTASCLFTNVSTFSQGSSPLSKWPLAILPSFPPASSFPK